MVKVKKKEPEVKFMHSNILHCSLRHHDSLHFALLCLQPINARSRSDVSAQARSYAGKSAIQAHQLLREVRHKLRKQDGKKIQIAAYSCFKDL